MFPRCAAILVVVFFHWGFISLKAQQQRPPSTNIFVNFETAPLHSVALSPDQATLAVVNLPDARVELFDVRDSKPLPLGSVLVGIDPVTVRFRTTNELWIVNHISDSISIVRLPELRIEDHLDTADGPFDVVFAGSPEKAFVSCAGSNVVQVFRTAPANVGLLQTISIDGDRPKAMSVSPDGQRVYVAIFESGNGSTILAGDFSFLDSFPPPSVVDFPNGPHSGQNPPPNRGKDFVPAMNPAIPSTNLPPRTSLIVNKNDDGRWMDDNSGDWTEFISGTNSFFTGRPKGWDTADHDVAVINTSTMATSYIKRLMNICMDLAINPATGDITVIGTDASNEVRFEPNLNGIFVQAKLALVSPNGSQKKIQDLNPHLDYKTTHLSPAKKLRSIGDPRGIIWNSSGTRAYVAGMGSNNILIYDQNGTPAEPNPVITVPGGPVGLALNETRNLLYVHQRFLNSISVIDLAKGTVIETVKMFDPTPAVIHAGRKHFYNTHVTSGLGQAACASCHVDGRFDRLAWDLGDPAGAMIPVTTTNRNFSRFPPSERRDFHPMKGPMVTQSLQDIIGHEPFHWRGDRDGIEQFNSTYTNLQAASAVLLDDEMKELKAFLASIHFPPNPYRTLSNGLAAQLPLPGFTVTGHLIDGPQPGAPFRPGNPNAGLQRFRLAGAAGCIHCHSLPTGLGPHMTFQTNRWRELRKGPNDEHHVALIGVRRSGLVPFKIPSLRNLHEKIGFSLDKPVSRSGFGFLHDGSVDSLAKFLQDSLQVQTEFDTANLLSFLFSFTGSDLPGGSLVDPDRPMGLPGKDAHAAVGKQVVLTLPNQSPVFNTLLTAAQSISNRVELIAWGFKNDVPRSWLFEPQRNQFLSDRTNEVETLQTLNSLMSAKYPVVFMAVATGTGRRLAIDRDLDGFPNRAEIESHSDPCDPFSIPIFIRSAGLVNGFVEFSWNALPGRKYQVQYKDKLNGTDWIDLHGEILAEGPTVRFKEAEPSSSARRFFRVREVK